MTNRMLFPYVDVDEKEREPLARWFFNLKCLHKNYCLWQHVVNVVVHWAMCKRKELPTETKSYEHTPEGVLKNGP